MDKEKKQQTDEKLRQYTIIALAVFITFCCCILFFFIIYRYNGFTNFWKKLFGILQPIIIGLVLAYLLNPVMSTIESWAKKLLKPRMKNQKKAVRLSRGIGITGAWLLVVGIVMLLMVAIVPAVSKSIQEMVTGFPEEVSNLVAWVEDFTKGDTEIAEFVRNLFEKTSKSVQDFMEKDILPQAQKYLLSITSGVIYGVKFLLNILVGVVVSVYVLSSKEIFAGQAKKIVYAVFKPVRANVIIHTLRKSNEIFGGFITGKILDSAIIGVLAYIVLAIMQMPDTVLLAVIIGVTNVIPFFGPFIGAIPSFIIVVLQNPVQGLYFLIFILVLQQIDGNIIGPKILGNSTGLSSFWVVFAIMVFGGLWGFPGMLLGVPLMAVIYYITQKCVRYFLRKRGLAEDTQSYVYMTSVDERTNRLLYERKNGKKRALQEEEKDGEKDQEETSGEMR